MIAKERETRSRSVAKERGARLRGRKGIVMTWQREVGKVAEDEKDREQSTWGRSLRPSASSSSPPSHVYFILQTSTAFLLHDRPLNITWFRLCNDQRRAHYPLSDPLSDSPRILYNLPQSQR
jgi:hypothetical protein